MTTTLTPAQLKRQLDAKFTLRGLRLMAELALQAALEDLTAAGLADDHETVKRYGKILKNLRNGKILGKWKHCSEALAVSERKVLKHLGTKPELLELHEQGRLRLRDILTQQPDLLVPQPGKHYGY